MEMECFFEKHFHFRFFIYIFTSPINNKNLLLMKSLVTTTFAIILLFAGVSDVSSTVRYVKSGASGNGSSWVTASGELQSVINESSDGDQIWIASGTYIPNRQINNINIVTSGNRDNADRRASCRERV